MRFILIISLIAALVFINCSKPDYVTANEIMVDRCTQSMLLNPDLVCD